MGLAEIVEIAGSHLIRIAGTTRSLRRRGDYLVWSDTGERYCPRTQDLTRDDWELVTREWWALIAAGVTIQLFPTEKQGRAVLDKHIQLGSTVHELIHMAEVLPPPRLCSNYRR